MKPLLMILLPALTLAGCATGPNLESRMAAYTGDSAQQLVQSLGVPDKQITLNGTTYLAYVKRQEQLDPGSSGFTGFYQPFYGAPIFAPAIYGGGFPAQITTYSCETTFVLKDDKVVSFSLRGNDCE